MINHELWKYFPVSLLVLENIGLVFKLKHLLVVMQHSDPTVALKSRITSPNKSQTITFA